MIQQKNDRDKNVTEDDLLNTFEYLNKLGSAFLIEAKLFLQGGGQNGHIHYMDLYTSAIINRSIYPLDRKK